ncbi:MULTISPECIES: hypothetical protein [Actinomadura]|uniref:Uncharacterized protein n=1 Tax=Actinomadura yumaensis TaxID=111807 RepID=A0ABW2D3J0_9ACTN|nr:hypothetical protein [Actinomadura sp. J1-007]MWK38891.1 hypothetical protein [Actinomadura sp. J1-007]
MSLRYIGSGPYCYANSLAMVLGDGAPPPSVIEVLTGSPFGLQLHQGRTPYFDPLGWDPGIGVDAALGLLGWDSRRTGGGTADEAAERLREEARKAPVLVGPVEMGLLFHQPEANGAIGADHFLVVTGIEKNTVLMHDPHGHPYATLPMDDFVAAWRTDTIDYPAESFTMRTDFRRARDVGVPAALRGSVADARRWLDGPDAAPPDGSLANAAAAERLAELVEAGLDPDVRAHLVHFAVRVGAHRLADAAALLAGIGLAGAARIAAVQARLVGGLQYPLVADDRPAAARILRELAPTYARLREALDEPLTAVGR